MRGGESGLHSCLTWSVPPSGPGIFNTALGIWLTASLLALWGKAGMEPQGTCVHPGLGLQNKAMAH